MRMRGFEVRLKTDWEPALSNTLCKQIKPLSEVSKAKHTYRRNTQRNFYRENAVLAR